MSLYFIRHGETEYNRDDKLQGLSDSPLTEKGLVQVNKFAEFFADKNIQKIYASPLERTNKTASIIAKKLSKEVSIIENLKETCYGEWEEKSKTYLKCHPLWGQRARDKYNFVHPGEFLGKKGESYADCYRRIVIFLQGIKSSNLMISHLGTLRNIRKFYEQVSDDEAVSFSPKNNQVYVVELDDEGKFMGSRLEEV